MTEGGQAAHASRCLHVVVRFAVDIGEGVGFFWRENDSPSREHVCVPVILIDIRRGPRIFENLLNVVEVENDCRRGEGEWKRPDRRECGELRLGDPQAFGDVIQVASGPGLMIMRTAGGFTHEIGMLVVEILDCFPSRVVEA